MHGVEEKPENRPAGTKSVPDIRMTESVETLFFLAVQIAKE
jgi:hypothetical protein